MNFEDYAQWRRDSGDPSYADEGDKIPKIIVQGGVVVEVIGLDEYEIIDLDEDEGD